MKTFTQKLEELIESAYLAIANSLVLIGEETDETVDYVLTNDKGFYILNNVKSGSYKLSVNAIVELPLLGHDSYTL